MPVRRSLVAVLATIAAVAAACGSSGGEAAVSAEQTTTSSGGSSGFVSCEVSREAGADGDELERIPSTATEDVPSALDDRSNSAFPDPLVDIGRILSGGPPPDGIPAIEEPRFVPVAQVDYVADCEPVVVLSIDGQARAYPIHIMTRHEIVNDAFGDIPVTVTYCPLCSSAVAYDRRVGDRILDFGTSGSLYNSALVMYDRQTESLWSHFTGQAIVGHLTGTELDTIPMATVSYDSFREAYPDGYVLSRNTGYGIQYGANPYIGYDTEGTRPFLFDGEAPDDFADKERFIGVERNGETVAVQQELVFAEGVVPFTVGGDDLIAWIEPGTPSPLVSDTVSDGRDIGASGVFVPEVDGQPITFSRTQDGFVDDETGSTWDVLGHATAGELAGAQLEAVAHLDTFWFAWTAFHPDTAVVD
ncbi:MAG: DUF3179 domain-containing protein [Acidimicrobiales bacterium]